MCSRGVLVHCPSRLGATAAVLAAELLCGDRVFAKGALERSKAIDHFDGVISHSFKCSRLFRYDSELKLPDHLSRMNRDATAVCGRSLCGKCRPVVRLR